MAAILLKDLVTEILSQCIYQKRLFWISVGMLYLILTQITIVLCKDAKSVSSSLDLQCPPCNQIFCMPKKAKRLSCKGGVTKGVCNCCPVCAKVEGETCGGAHNYLGKCDVGLVCVPENIINDVLASDYSSEKLTVSSSNSEGICKRVLVKTFPPDFVGDEPRPTCAKKCTPEFCEENPRAICSAINNADNRQECQGECQHTSCRACRFVYDSHPCGKCRKDDFKCLKKFGTCMRKQTCSRISFPCKKSKKKNPLLKNATFKCTVPECI